MAKSRLRLVAPGTVNRTVTPRRPPNADLRTREYLTETEVERLLRATRNNRWAHRDATMILVAYRHGLRASELTDLRRSSGSRRTPTCSGMPVGLPWRPRGMIRAPFRPISGTQEHPAHSALYRTVPYPVQNFLADLTRCERFRLDRPYRDIAASRRHEAAIPRTRSRSCAR